METCQVCGVEKHGLVFKTERDRRNGTILCYPNSELGIFSGWLEDIYEQQYLNKYLQDKYGKLVKI
jgi:hypothetical protein